MKTSRIAVWIRRVATDLGWTDLTMAAGVALLLMLFGPHGGYFLTTFHEGVDPIFDPGKHYLRSFTENIFLLGLPIVLGVRIADLAIDDGVPAFVAYALVLLAAGAVRHLYLLMPFSHHPDSPAYPAEIPWHYMTIFMQGGIGLVIYARWRASKRSLALTQASETARAYAARRLQSARLLALQARVDPQLLFDTLGAIGRLETVDRTRADDLLGDLIALLRAMLPGETSLMSTVRREVALVQAWLRVARVVTGGLPPVYIRCAEETLESAMAPLLVLPLLRMVLETHGAVAVHWRLEITTSVGRLLVALTADDASPIAADDVLPRLDLTGLRQRVATLHGDAGRIWLDSASLITLDLPFQMEPSEGSPAEIDTGPLSSSQTAAA